MPAQNIYFGKSSSSLADKKDFRGDRHFEWDSIKKFIYLTFTFSSSSYNFDMFSRISDKVTIFDFVIVQIVMGMSYLFMDFFIKQYTAKLDFNNSLNPLLRGVTYGMLIQTGLWTLLHANDLADASRYFAAGVYGTAAWSKCHLSNNCISSIDLLLRCRQQKITTINVTSAHLNYQRMFLTNERSVLTTKFFVIGIVWICNFFFSTVTDQTMIKLFKLSFMLRLISTILIILLVMMSTKYYTSDAFKQVLSITGSFSSTSAVSHVSYIYGIGIVGLYDFGTMSPYTMIDNAVVIFSILFTVLAFFRSILVRILYLALKNCVDFDTGANLVSPHYLLFALLPLCTDFLHAHKLFIFYLYLNMMVALAAYIALMTLSMSKLLHSEFGSVKNLYIVGLLCFIGFTLSLPICASFTYITGLLYGINVTLLYLGGLKAAIVMWLYGVHRFADDIHFWLGFKPPKFWIICWMLLPSALLYFLSVNVFSLLHMPINANTITAYVWILFIILVVLIFHVKTIAKYMVQNNLPAAFRYNAKYGPPETDERRRRRRYDETTQFRQCRHNCIVLDDRIDCNHLPLMHKTRPDSEISIQHIYEAGPSKKVTDSISQINEESQDYHPELFQASELSATDTGLNYFNI